MRTYTILILLFTFCLMQQCKKPEGDDVSGNLEIKGKLEILNTLINGGQATALADQIIRIKKDSLSPDYLFTVKTDRDGNFHITNLSKTTYYLYSEKKISDILYSGGVNIKLDDDISTKLTLSPTANDYNILSITVRDGSTLPPGLLSNVSVCLFNTWAQAKKGDCSVAIWNANTDKHGHAQTTNLSSGRYYLHATLTNGSSSLIKNDSVDIPATGIIPKEILLQQNTLFDITGEVFINDTLSGYNEETPLSSQVILIKKEADSANQNFFQKVTSNNEGVFSSQGLPAGTYWLLAEKIINGVHYADTAIVNTNSYSKLVLFPDAKNYNVLQVTTKDSATRGLLNNVTVCIFSSRLVADSSDCNNALRSDISNNNGRFTTTRLPAPGKYYINALFTLGSAKLMARDSVEVTTSGIIQKTVFLK